MQYLIVFIPSFLLTMICCFNADDDAAYKFLDRAPTKEEIFARARFGISNILACLYGGACLALYVARPVLLDLISLTEIKRLIVPILSLSLFLRIRVYWWITKYNSLLSRQADTRFFRSRYYKT